MRDRLGREDRSNNPYTNPVRFTDNPSPWRSANKELPALRRAITANVFKGGKSVIARSSADKPHFRIVGVKYRRGVVYGQALNSGKWIAICDWDTF